MRRYSNAADGPERGSGLVAVPGVESARGLGTLAAVWAIAGRLPGNQ